MYTIAASSEEECKKWVNRIDNLMKNELYNNTTKYDDIVKPNIVNSVPILNNNNPVPIHNNNSTNYDNVLKPTIVNPVPIRNDINSKEMNNDNISEPSQLFTKSALSNVQLSIGKSAFTSLSEDDKSLSSYNAPAILQDGFSTLANPSISTPLSSTIDYNMNDNMSDPLKRLNQCTEEIKRENELFRKKYENVYTFNNSYLHIH